MSHDRDFAAMQLEDFAKSKKNQDRLTTSFGAPVGNRLATLTAGARGPILLQDTVLLDELASFDRERIPERVVHAKGSGAFGFFEVTHDITKYSKAVVFDKIGKKTPIAVRFSTVGGESGSADTVRDPRGFAVKFYTEDGIWDLVGNNTPIFFIRDPILFPSFLHTQKRNPQTHLKDKNMFWDFISLRPETTHQVMFLFSDRGIPNGYRHMNGYGSHTFKLVNDKNEHFYCKFHLKTDQGIDNLPANKADELAGTEPDYSQKDLFNAIASGKYPSWSFKIQIMTEQQAQKFRWNPFDLTKIWPQSEYPLITVGRVVLDRNPNDYFAEVEQIAFAPAHMIPGIEASPDKMLQGRLFSYVDTHRHRLGPNYLQIPVNCPYSVRNYQRDGPHRTDGNQPCVPNYFPNSFSGPMDEPKHLDKSFEVTGKCERYNTKDDDNFTQAGDFWRKVLKPEERERLANNIADHLKGAADFIRNRAIENFSKVDPDFGKRIRDRIQINMVVWYY